MSVTRSSAGTFVALLAVVIVTSSAASPERKKSAPKIVVAAMLDADRDARADRVRVTYSQRVRHARDRDGRYPFAVTGYRISSIGSASGKTLVVLLVEKSEPDPAAQPAIRYLRTRSQPVRGMTGVQAAAQLFRSPQPHGQTPQPTPPGTPPTDTPSDSDGDGTLDALDCAPQDRAIHPNAADRPDLSFVDSNCDGIDGTDKDAVFASPKGNDGNPGTKGKPKREIQAAVQAATGKGKYVLAARGEYGRVTAASNVDVYGGYDPDRWSRSNNRSTQITGAPEGVFADAATHVTLQLLTVRGVVTGGVANGDNAYGIRAINGSSLMLQRVNIFAGDAALGPPGSDGAAGRPGSPGLPGARGGVDSDVKAFGGAGGESPAGRNGGNGGDGRYEAGGKPGGSGLIGTPGGIGGDLTHGEGGINPGASGGTGQNGTGGAAGVSGAGGSNFTTLATTLWIAQGGGVGASGAPGNGGGGGGGGGGQTGYFVINGTGGGGGGGGGAGEGGAGGAGGGAGGGSFGLYLHNSSLVAQDSTITAGTGGPGGRGGNGGPGGDGGVGGAGGGPFSVEVGAGGDGGRGGNGGQGGGGGGGAGGPSVGIFKAGTAEAKLDRTTVQFGSPGAGGASGASGSIFANPLPAQAGIAAAVYP